MKQLTVTVKLEGKALLVAVAANCANATAFARGEITRADNARAADRTRAAASVR